MSCQTRTWASQLGPAPIPMVGMCSRSVISAAMGAGTISMTTEEAPASCTARASSMRRDAASPRPCTR